MGKIPRYFSPPILTALLTSLIRLCPVCHGYYFFHFLQKEEEEEEEEEVVVVVEEEEEEEEEEDCADDRQPQVQIPRFTYRELKIITRNFSLKIGYGGLASVYHGHLADGDEVAVKVMDETSTLYQKRLFRNQIQILSKVHHKNLISLVGYCNVKGKPLAAVFEFMPGGSLFDAFSGRPFSIIGNHSLSWDERLQIAIDVAQGLDYLHNVCPELIIHRAVNTSNILLGRNREAKLDGFEVARLLDSDTEIDTSIPSVSEIPGDIDPQYFMNRVINRKTDVYSYGVVLLGIITGQHPILRDELQDGERVYIVKYIESRIERGASVDDIADPSLQGEYDTNSVWMVMDLGKRCTAQTSTERPTITEVLMQLRKSLALETARKRSKSSNSSINTRASTVTPESDHERSIKQHQPDMDHEDSELPSVTHRYTYMELETITGRFAKRLGEGGFGIVFYGILENGTKVAVKMLSSTSEQGSDEFLAEVSSLSQVRHRNLVSLVGYCKDTKCMALVYEYMPQGSLDNHLRGGAGSAGALSWIKRLGIAFDAARGLDYLLNGLPEPIIHRDVKTSNILLNKKLEAKVSDFGLSRTFDKNLYTHVTAEPAFSRGYLDPECFNIWKFSEKTDVYSFGVVLLEIVTGQPAILKYGENALHIVDHVKQNLKRGNIDEIADAKLRKDYNVSSVQKVVDLAMACTGDRIRRPSMTDVFLQLKECLALETARASSKNIDCGSTETTEYKTASATFSSSA